MTFGVLFALILAAAALYFLTRSTGRPRQGPVISVEAVMEPYRRGDYEASLQAAEGLRHGTEITAPYCFFRGANLANLGRLEEAETWLRRNVAMHEQDREKRHLAIALTRLGHLMLQAGRYDEAQKYFESSLGHVPERGSGYRGMAESYLLRGGNPAEALRWAKLAVEHEQSDPGIPPGVRTLNLSEDLATLAWATAAGAGSPPEVARLVTQAIEGAGASHVATTAQVHYQSGCAYAALGDRRTSDQHYGEAARLDPRGHWGRVARAALRGGQRPAGA